MARSWDGSRLAIVDAWDLGCDRLEARARGLTVGGGFGQTGEFRHATAARSGDPARVALQATHARPYVGSDGTAGDGALGMGHHSEEDDCSDKDSACKSERASHEGYIVPNK